MSAGGPMIHGMAYDEELAFRVRATLDDAEGLTEKAMFGGLAFLLDGNMAIAVSNRGGLMVRLNPGEAEDLLGRPGVSAFEMRGKPIAGWLRVDAVVVEDDDDLQIWVDRCTEFAGSLPAK